jgi:hypothetical protein
MHALMQISSNSIFIRSVAIFSPITTSNDTPSPLAAPQGLFNVGDLIGRVLSGFKAVFNEKTLWIPVLIRVGFIPLFLFLAKDRTFLGDAHNAISCVTMLAFSISNGYCGSLSKSLSPTDPPPPPPAGLAMMFGPEKMPFSEKEMAGTFMVGGEGLGANRRRSFV